MRKIVNAILYITKAGCQWRMLPGSFPPWQSVYYYFRTWKNYGIIEETHDKLVEKARLRKDKKASPSVGIIDSPSVKTVNICQGNIGYDGGKKAKGRKRHIIVDTLGLLIAVVIQPANLHDSKGAYDVLLALKDKYLNAIKKVFADGGCRGDTLRDWAFKTIGCAIGVVKRNEQDRFKVLPKRWIVEHTFAWVSFQRRMSKDYERLSGSSTAFAQLSMIRVMLNKF